MHKSKIMQLEYFKDDLLEYCKEHNYNFEEIIKCPSSCNLEHFMFLHNDKTIPSNQPMQIIITVERQGNGYAITAEEAAQNYKL